MNFLLYAAILQKCCVIPKLRYKTIEYSIKFYCDWIFLSFSDVTCDGGRLRILDQKFNFLTCFRLDNSYYQRDNLLFIHFLHPKPIILKVFLLIQMKTTSPTNSKQFKRVFTASISILRAFETIELYSKIHLNVSCIK